MDPRPGNGVSYMTGKQPMFDKTVLYRSLSAGIGVTVTAYPGHVDNIGRFLPLQLPWLVY